MRLKSIPLGKKYLNVEAYATLEQFPYIAHVFRFQPPMMYMLYMHKICNLQLFKQNFSYHYMQLLVKKPEKNPITEFALILSSYI